MTPLRQTLSAAALAAAAFTFAPTVAPAEAPEAPFSQGRAYKVWLGGIKVADAHFTVTADGDSYQGVLALSSDGVLDWFTEATIRSEATGGFSGDDAFAPDRFVFRSEIDNQPQAVDLIYRDGGPDSVVAEPPFDPRPWEIAPSAQNGALDPISAVVSAFFPADAGEICDRTLDIYDGRRRYEIALTDEVKRETDDGVLEVDCVARWRRVAGFKPKQMRQPGYDFTVRFEVSEDGVTTPVRAWAETEFGALIAVAR